MTYRDIGALFWFAALGSVALSAGAQLLMKVGMTEVRALGPATSLLAALAQVALSPLVIAGLACYGLSAGLWLIVLTKMPLSMAYPLVALAIAAVVVSSALLLGETVSPLRIGGVALIVVGVILIGQS